MHQKKLSVLLSIDLFALIRRFMTAACSVNMRSTINLQLATLVTLVIAKRFPAHASTLVKLFQGSDWIRVGLT